VGPITAPNTVFINAAGKGMEASCRGAIELMLESGYPAPKIIAGLPFYSSNGQSWIQAQAGWETWPVHDDYMEAAQPNGPWWTTPAALERKIDALVNPATTVLTGPSGPVVIGGIGFWEWGHEDPAAPALTRAIKAKLP
jgi:hypothetical protein